jgi:hypothetical protein
VGEKAKRKLPKPLPGVEPRLSIYQLLGSAITAHFLAFPYTDAENRTLVAKIS